MFDFRLGINDVASYKWGSCYTTFALAPVHNNILVQTGAGLSAEAAPWDTAGEFRAVAAYLHELVHYLQDVQTGVGHWDYCAREANLPKLLMWAQWRLGLDATESDEFENTPWQENLTGDQGKLQEELVFVPNLVFPTERRARLIEMLKASNEKQLKAGAELHFLPESLLEAEAVATTYLQLSHMRMSDPQYAIWEDNRELFTPGHLTETYDGPLHEFIGFMRQLFGDQEHERLRQQAPDNYFDYILRLMIFLIDLALTYPPQALLAARSQDRTEYEPGLKFMRLLHAFEGIAPTEGELFPAAYRQGDYATAERCLLGGCTYPYATSQEVCQAWLDEFSRRAQSSDNGLLDLRKRTCEHRLDSKSMRSCIYKDLESVVFNGHSAPPMQTPKGFVYTLLGDDIVNPKFAIRMVDTQWEAAVWRLVDHFAERRPFVCPFTASCAGEVVACSTGIRRSHEFPPERDCRIRQFLQKHKFAIRDPCLSWGQHNAEDAIQ
jgi:hypothetical protein